MRGDRRACRRANGANVRSGWGGGQVRAEMELRPQENNPEQQRQDTDTLCSAVHVLTKTKLRLEWLRGQVRCQAGGGNQTIHPLSFVNKVLT